MEQFCDISDCGSYLKDMEEIEKKIANLPGEETKTKREESKKSLIRLPRNTSDLSKLCLTIEDMWEDCREQRERFAVEFELYIDWLAECRAYLPEEMRGVGEVDEKAKESLLRDEEVREEMWRVQDEAFEEEDLERVQGLEKMRMALG